jgi:hypothetical protein
MHHPMKNLHPSLQMRLNSPLVVCGLRFYLNVAKYNLFRTTSDGLGEIGMRVNIMQTDLTGGGGDCSEEGVPIFLPYVCLAWLNWLYFTLLYYF